MYGSGFLGLGLPAFRLPAAQLAAPETRRKFTVNFRDSTTFAACDATHSLPRRKPLGCNASHSLPLQKTMSSVDLTKPTYSNGGKHLTMTAVPVEAPTVLVETAVAVEKPTVVAEHRSKPAAELSWRNVTYTIKQKKQTKEILSDVSGSLEAASLLAIMGPSGSGKTSLLNTLAGRVPITRSAKLHGSVLVNGVPCEGKMPMISAYVEQDEALFALSTVRETFAFAARLRLPPSTSEEARARRVDEIISELGLVACADTLVGNQRVRGVSGGERKRVNIGVELLNDPP